MIGGQGSQAGRGLWWVAWLYLLLVVLAWLVMRGAGDRWWPATLLLFGPRWMFALPLILLLPLSLWFNRRAALVLAVSGLIIAGPLMGLQISLLSGTAGQRGLRVLTCNTDTGSANKRLDQLIGESAADIVALQECPRELPVTVPKGWHFIKQGELAILSRFPLVQHGQLMSLHPPHTWPRYSALLAIIDTPQGKIGFCAVHLPSPRYGLEHLLDRRTGINLAKTDLIRKELAVRSTAAWELRRLLASLPLPLIVAGDFNMPVESSLYRENLDWLTNGFSVVGTGYGHTHFAAKRGIPLSTRIDHILTSRELRPLTSAVGPDVGSDHLPLIADISVARL